MKRILIMLAAVGILLLMASCGRDSARVEICSDGSWLGDYTITGDQVDFFCTVKIKNTGSEEQKINLYGDFSEDMAGALLKTGRLIAHPADDPAGTVLSAGLLMAGSVSWGSVVTVGVPLLRTMSAGTYSTALVRWVRSWTGAPTAPIRDTAEVTDTGHSSRNSTTAHRA